MQGRILTAGLLLLLVATSCNAAAVVEHSLDAGRSFQQIGLMRLEDDIRGTQPIVTGLFERQPLTTNQLNQLKQLVEQDRLYLWRVKLEGQPAVLTSIKAACLAQHYQHQSPILTLDNAGRIISSQLSIPPTQDGACSVSKALAQLQQLSVDESTAPEPLKVIVNTPKQAPSVPRGPSDLPAVDLSTATGAPQTPAAQKQQQQRSSAAAVGQQGASSDGQQQQGGAEGEQQQPAPDTRTWWEKNWLFVMAAGTMVLNIAMKAAVGDGTQQGQMRPGGAAGGRAVAAGPAVRRQ